MSTSFCLPVKYGWHLEQISTRSSLTFLVVPVWNVFPHAHTTVTSWYSGWIPSFILVLLSRFFTPTRASMLREYDIKFLYYIFLAIKCQAYASTLLIFFACSCHTLFSRFSSYFASAASNRLRSNSRSRSVSARDFLSLVMLPLSATCTGLPSSTKYSSAQSKHSSIA